MQVQSAESRHETVHLEVHRPDRHSWLEINHTLNRDARSLLDEQRLERRIEDVLQLHADDRRLLWLTLARIAELAIVQAGIYADGCEFQAAGDLLVNPRRIDMYLKGRWRPIVKRRHTRLSDQFEADIGQESPACWLAREATPRLATEAILPWLSRTLASSGAMAYGYLRSLDRRMARVADTLAFLIAWRIEDAVEFHQRIRSMDPHGRAFIEFNLCRFDTQRFVAMYTDIQDILYTNRCSTRFVASVNSPTHSCQSPKTGHFSVQLPFKDLQLKNPRSHGNTSPASRMNSMSHPRPSD